MRLVLALCAAGLLGVAADQLKGAALAERAGWPPEDEYAILPPPSAAPFLYAGFREAGADITWMRALVYYGSSRIGESDFRYLEKFIDNILVLDPRFKRVYVWAAYAVMFKGERATQDEIRLSIKYLERGIREYPDDYDLFWLLGLRYFIDLDSPDPAERRRYRERGAELIEQAMRKPNAPPNLPTLAAAMRTKLGQEQRALGELREMILTIDRPEARARLLKRYAELAQRPELAEALEDAAVDFHYDHLANLPYVPDALFAIIGPRPDPAFHFDQLANERDLFGAEELELLDQPPAGEEPVAPGSE